MDSSGGLDPSDVVEGVIFKQRLEANQLRLNATMKAHHYLSDAKRSGNRVFVQTGSVFIGTEGVDETLKALEVNAKVIQNKKKHIEEELQQLREKATASKT